MPYQRQTGFAGGLNTRLPSHQLPEGVTANLINAEIDNGEIRTLKGFGGIGGGDDIFYEKGETWVNANGFDQVTLNQIILESNTTVTVNNTWKAANAATDKISTPLLSLIHI